MKDEKLNEEAVENQVMKSDDSDMPQPMTKEYKKVVRPKELFYTLFNNMIGNLPYDTILVNDNDKQISIVQLHAIVNKADKMIELDLMNAIIGFIKKLPFAKVNELMSYIVDKDRQGQLWEVDEI